MVRGLLSFAIGGCALAHVTTAACADELPVRKPGLWEMKIVKVGSQLPALTTQQCTDPSVDKEMVNAGHIATYNEGLAWAAGEYTVLLSADDVLAPGALARAVALLDSRAEVGFVYGHSIRFNGDTGVLPTARMGPVKWEIWPGQEWLAVRCRAGHNSISSPEVVARTSLYRELGGYRAELPHSGDLEIWMRFAAHRDVGYIAGADQAFYRIHAASMQSQWLTSKVAELRQRKAAYDALFAAQSPAIRDAPRLHDLANRALAKEALWRACRAFDRRRLVAEQAGDLVEFAQDTYPAVTSLPEWRGWRRRTALGPGLSGLLRPLRLPGLLRHRLQSWLWWRAWRLHGV